MRILLLAEDLEVVVAFRPLVSWGHRVWVAESITGAFNKMKETPLELVVVDHEIFQKQPERLQALLVQPGMNGSPVPMAAVGFTTGKEAHMLSRPPSKDDLFEMVLKLANSLEPSPLNHKTAMMQCDEDEELLHDISEVFLGDAPNQLEKIREGFKNDNFALVSSAAHSLKGAAGNLAAENLYDAAQELERASHSRESATSRAHFAQVQYHFIRLKRHLENTILSGN